MAVIQISRIQHRRGLADELPDALAEGELGFATDTGELFIGAPSTEMVANRKAYPFKNIKVLTEFDVQRSITGDVYYHGPLKSDEISKYAGSGTGIDFNNPSCLKVPLFRLDQATYGIYDFSISEITTGFDTEGNAVIKALYCGMVTVAAGLSGQDITPGLTNHASVNGGATVVSGTKAQLTSGAVASTGNISITAECVVDGANQQVNLIVVDRTGNALGPLKLHFSGREWLAGPQV